MYSSDKHNLVNISFRLSNYIDMHVEQEVDPIIYTRSYKGTLEENSSIIVTNINLLSLDRKNVELYAVVILLKKYTLTRGEKMTPEGFIVVFLLVLGAIAILVDIDIKRRKRNVVKNIFGDIKCCATKEGLKTSTPFF